MDQVVGKTWVMLNGHNDHIKKPAKAVKRFCARLGAQGGNAHVHLHPELVMQRFGHRYPYKSGLVRFALFHE